MKRRIKARKMGREIAASTIETPRAFLSAFFAGTDDDATITPESKPKNPAPVYTFSSFSIG
jgi:hypothetical protein